MDELYWFLEYKPRTETRENIYIMTMVSREPRQIIGHVVSRDKTSKTIQKMVDAAPDAERYCTDGYSGYLDVIFPGKHIFNIHNKNDTFTVEGVNADLRHYIPTLAHRSRCFPQKLENLQAVLEAVPIGDGMQIGEKNFLPGKEETRRNPDGFQAFLTQPDENFSVKMPVGAYWYSCL